MFQSPPAPSLSLKYVDSIPSADLSTGFFVHFFNSHHPDMGQGLVIREQISPEESWRTDSNAVGDTDSYTDGLLNFAGALCFLLTVSSNAGVSAEI